MGEEQETQRFTGRCLCGACAYSYEGPVLSVIHCHCGMCRKAAGAPFTTWITVPKAGLSWVEGTPKPHRSSRHAERTFCPSCGSPLTFQTDKYPEEIDVTLGTLDEPERFPATANCFTGNRLSWVKADLQLPDYPADPDHKDR